jgi:hypothetical protein
MIISTPTLTAREPSVETGARRPVIRKTSAMVSVPAQPGFSRSEAHTLRPAVRARLVAHFDLTSDGLRMRWSLEP